VVLQLTGGTIVPTSTTTPIGNNEGHIHLLDNGSVISMAYGTEQDISLTPGPHSSKQSSWRATTFPSIQGDRLRAHHRSVRLSAAQTTRVTTPAAVGLGLLALAARVPSTWAVLVTAGVGVVGLLAPVEAPSATRPLQPASAANWLTSVALGLVAMLIAARLPGLLGLRPHGAGASSSGRPRPAVAASVVAAVAEEVFFRRLVYGWLASSWGAAVAICGSAVAFAAIHVPVYGFAVLPSTPPRDSCSGGSVG